MFYIFCITYNLLLFNVKFSISVLVQYNVVVTTIASCKLVLSATKCIGNEYIFFIQILLGATLKKIIFIFIRVYFCTNVLFTRQ